MSALGGLLKAGATFCQSAGTLLHTVRTISTGEYCDWACSEHVVLTSLFCVFTAAARLLFVPTVRAFVHSFDEYA